MVDMYGALEYIQMGWQCPVCKRVYAPQFPWCTFCGNQETVTTDAVQVGKDYENPILSKDIAVLNLPTMTENTLRRGFNNPDLTVGELVRIYQKDNGHEIQRLRNIGSVGFSVIYNALKEHGLIEE